VSWLLSRLSRLVRFVSWRTEERGRPLPLPLVSRLTFRRLDRPSASFMQSILATDPQLVALLNEKVVRIVGGGFFFEPTERTYPDLLRRVEEWSRRLNLQGLLRDIVFDVLLCGNSFVYVAPNLDLSDVVAFFPLDPDRVDYKRKENKYVEIDEWGRPRALIIKDVFGQEQEVPPILVAHFAFWKLPGSYLGFTPLTACINVLLLRNRLETRLGNTLLMTGAPLYVVNVVPRREGEVVTAADLDEANAIWQEGLGIDPKKMERLGRIPITELRTLMGLTLPGDRMSLQRFDPPRIQPITEFLEYLRELAYACFETPLALATGRLPRGGGRGAVEAERTDYERRITFYQRLLETKIQQEILGRLALYWDVDPGEMPLFRLKVVAPAIKLSKARRMAVYARAGLLKPSPEVEDAVRRYEGLPSRKED